MMYVIKPVVCDYAVICVDTGKVICVYNIKRNAELIADILNGDNDNKIMDWLEQKPVIQKTGYWIKIGDKGLGYNDIVKCKCSECGFQKEFPGKFDGQKLIVDMKHAYKHCPDCGVPMVEQKAESYMTTNPTTIYKKLKLTDDDI